MAETSLVLHRRRAQIPAQVPRLRPVALRARAVVATALDPTIQTFRWPIFRTTWKDPLVESVRSIAQSRNRCSLAQRKCPCTKVWGTPRARVGSAGRLKEFAGDL